MGEATIQVKPATPGKARGGKRFFADLLAAIDQVRRPGWHQVAQFRDQPRRAYWYSSRLRKKATGGYQFCANVTGGVGTLYCRRAGGAA